jgi:hypothetical protein
MFKFFRKREVEPELDLEAEIDELQEEFEKEETSLAKEERVSTLSFHTDKEGYIWVDVYWSDLEGAHISFAELLEKVSSGDLIQDVFDFVKNKCETEEEMKLFSEILETITDMQKLRLFNNITGLDYSSLTPDNGPVVRPTKMIKNNK